MAGKAADRAKNAFIGILGLVVLAMLLWFIYNNFRPAPSASSVPTDPDQTVPEKKPVKKQLKENRQPVDKKKEHIRTYKLHIRGVDVGNFIFEYPDGLKKEYNYKLVVNDKGMRLDTGSFPEDFKEAVNTDKNRDTVKRVVVELVPLSEDIQGFVEFTESFLRENEFQYADEKSRPGRTELIVYVWELAKLGSKQK